MRILRHGLLIVLLGLTLVSCEKKEYPVTLPEKGTAIIDRVNMGEEYVDQIFYDFADGKIVMTSEVSSWDLAFETSPTGIHVFVNGGKDMAVHNTHESDISSVLTVPKLKENEWTFDAPCGLPDSSAIGQWADEKLSSKKEVYIIKINPAFAKDTFKKIVLNSVDDKNYVLTFGDLRSTTTKTITIPKDGTFNYTYFSFKEGGTIVFPEPPKDTWDIVFTRYRYVYHDWSLPNYPYLVNGVLLNPNNTTALRCDSTKAYQDIKTDDIVPANFSNFRDVIGFNWKLYNGTSGKYTVNQKKTYIIKSRTDQYWKIHFLDFYSSSGVKGSPTFEFERLQ